MLESRTAAKITICFLLNVCGVGDEGLVQEIGTDIKLKRSTSFGDALAARTDQTNS
jgi:hypothetical protein